ncbi:hypothetical protein D1822_07650 [Phaeobacter inhibens]|nr:hypothetical protein PhaeoP10_01564 [Phaeobacter inhibens]AXT22708.1 hypothetical protein D1822_07650 [Phaeobacter inhibens]
MLKEHRGAEFRAAKRSLLYLMPFLLLVGFGVLGLAGIMVLNPAYWFIALFPALLVGWWFGHRPLARLRNANRAALEQAVRNLEQRIKT